MATIQFDAHEVLKLAGTEYPGVQSAGALSDQIKHCLDQVNAKILRPFHIALECRRTTSDPAGMKFEIELVSF